MKKLCKECGSEKDARVHVGDVPGLHEFVPSDAAPESSPAAPTQKTTNLQKAFNELAVENAVDRAALLAHGFKYDLEDFVNYARQAWHLAKHDLLVREKTFDAESEVKVATE